MNRLKAEQYLRRKIHSRDNGILNYWVIWIFNGSECTPVYVVLRCMITIAVFS